MKAARIEAQRAVSTYTMAAVEARRLAGEVVPMDASPAGVGKVAYTLRVPIGVVGAISPFNFPLNLVAHKVAPALAAGCAVVLKPARQTPVSALLLAELETEAGPAAGLAQRRRRALVRDRRRPGRGRAREADHLHRLLRGRLEHPRARRAQEGDARARELDARCSSSRMPTSRTPPRGRAQRVLLRRPELHLRAAGLRAPDGLRRLPRALVPKVEALKRRSAEEETDVGPVIDEDARERILAWIEEARSQGATVLRAARSTVLIRPTVLADVHPDMKVSCRRSSAPSAPCPRTTRSRRPSTWPTGPSTDSRLDLHRESDSALGGHPARVRRGHGQRGADFPRRPDALRRRQGLRQHEGRPALHGAGDDRGAPRRRRRDKGGTLEGKLAGDETRRLPFFAGARPCSADRRAGRRRPAARGRRARPATAAALTPVTRERERRASRVDERWS